MTRAEAIEILKKLKPIPRRADGQSTTHLVITMALDMAINSLKVDEMYDLAEENADDFIPKSVIEDIKAEIEALETYEYDDFIRMRAVLDIIDKHISGKENNESPNL